MATSGSFLTNAISGGGRRGRLRFSWTSTSSVANNTSTISWTLKGVQELAGWQNAENFYVVVDGTRYTSAERRQLTEGLTVLSGTTVVTHNAAGARSFTASAGAAIYNYGSANSTGSGTYSLNTIPRASNITSFSRYAYSAKILDVQCAADKHFDQVSTRVNGGAWATISVGSRTSHNWSIGSNFTPATSYKVELQVKNTASGIWSATSTINISTAKLATAWLNPLEITAANVGQNTDVGITTHHELSGMRSTANLYCKKSDGTNLWLASLPQAVAGGRNFVITPAIKQSILTNTRTSTSVQMWVDITTYWNGRDEGTTYSNGMTTVTIKPGPPTIPSRSYSNATAAHVTLLGNNQYIIGGRSTLRLNYSGLTTWGFGNIVRVDATVGRTTSATTSSATSGSLDIASADAHGTVNAVIEVTDSRGATASVNVSVLGLPYAPPQVTNLNPERENQYEEPSWMKVNLRYNALEVNGVRKNTTHQYYRIKQNPSGAWGAWQTLNGSIGGSGQHLTMNINQYMSAYPSGNEYGVEFRVSDLVTGYDTTPGILRRGIPLLKFEEDRLVAGVPIFGPSNGIAGDTGRYHLGEQNLGNGTNLNNLQTEGTYYTPANVTAVTILNRPPGMDSAFSLRVEKNAGVTQFLTAYPQTATATYVRNFYGGTWGSWGVAGLGGTVSSSKVVTNTDVKLGRGSSSFESFSQPYVAKTIGIGTNYNIGAETANGGVIVYYSLTSTPYLKQFIIPAGLEQWFYETTSTSSIYVRVINNQIQVSSVSTGGARVIGFILLN